MRALRQTAAQHPWTYLLFIVPHILYLRLFPLSMRKKTPRRQCKEFGACGRTRTGDLLITSELLYQLSHTSISFTDGRYYTIFFSCRQLSFSARVEYNPYSTLRFSPYSPTVSGSPAAFLSVFVKITRGKTALFRRFLFPGGALNSLQVINIIFILFRLYKLLSTLSTEFSTCGFPLFSRLFKLICRVSPFVASP